MDWKKRIDDLDFIITDLENCAGFKKLLEIIEQEVKNIDEWWHLELDEEKLNELRVNKRAYAALVNSIDYLKGELQQAQHQLKVEEESNNE